MSGCPSYYDVPPDELWAGELRVFCRCDLEAEHDGKHESVREGGLRRYEWTDAEQMLPDVPAPGSLFWGSAA